MTESWIRGNRITLSGSKKFRFRREWEDCSFGNDKEYHKSLNLLI